MKRMVDDKFIKNIQDGNLTNIDLKVKTIEQSDYNWESANISISDSWSNGLTVSESFVKLCVVNKVLYVVCSLLLTNETESSITTNSPISLIAPIAIPEKIASKIYRKDGSNCSQPWVVNDCVIGATYRVSSYNGANKDLIEGNVFSSLENKIGLWANTGTTVAAGASVVMDFRTFIVL